MPQPIQKGPLLFCQKSGKIVGFRPPSRVLPWLTPIAGLFALLWHLLRVLLTPSRAEYPCQRVAGPMAWGFLGWLLSFAAAATAFDRDAASERASAKTPAESGWRESAPAGHANEKAGDEAAAPSTRSANPRPRVAVAIDHDRLIDVGFGSKDVVQSGAAVVGAPGDRWNAPDGAHGEKLELSDVKGLKSGTTLAFDSDHAYDAKDDTPFAHGPWQNLMRKYLCVFKPSKVTLEGLKPGAEFGVYLYSAADPGGNGRATRFTVGGKSQTTKFASDEKDLVEGVNYAAFTATADKNGRIEIVFTGDNGEHSEGNLNGLQIAPVKKR